MVHLKEHFIQATCAYNELFGEHVPAPYIRRSFSCGAETTAAVTVAACGFYELYLNGVRCTKGHLAPYVSNLDDYIYCDTYQLPLRAGENVVGLILGNGFLNNPGGYIWDFDKVPFRSAPMAALAMTWQEADGQEKALVSDASFRTAPSGIRSDDYRFGECFDANAVRSGWCEPGFDDSGWAFVHPVQPPRGELRICEAAPLVTEKELKPVQILPAPDGSYIYDFGESNAGVCRLTVRGTPGQEIHWQHADWMKNGDLYLDGVWFVREYWERDRDLVQRDSYVCRGGETETYTPFFTYHGFRYVKVSGITASQATPELLTFVVFHSRLNTRGSFACSDEIVNKLQENTRRSDVSNFHYFPTDCPQREKNGWTADAALSSEQLLLNFDPETSYREWMRNICKAQNDAGALPGIVPTYGWGYAWGNGPAWDSVLAYVPYYVYLYRGETDMIRESAQAFLAYLHYLTTRADEKGLMHIGLGDWCEVGAVASDRPQAPQVVTDTIMCVDIATKMAVMFDAVGMTAQKAFALSVADSFRKAFRENLLDKSTMTVLGNCQTCQAMAIYYGLLTEEEARLAFDRLLDLIHRDQDHFRVGVLGGRVLFHVLSRYGCSDMALRMIVGPDYPSYGEQVLRGATTLWEEFSRPGADRGEGYSRNHHFWGDISAWFYKCLAGIRLNPTTHDVNQVLIAPSFPAGLTWADGSHQAPAGLIRSAWKREGEGIVLTLEIPRTMKAELQLPDGYHFGDGSTRCAAESGTYLAQP